MNAFYNRIEKRLSFQFDFKRPILRKFFSIEEQNNWFAASDKVNLSPFLSTTLVHDRFDGIESPYGYGQVLHTGYVDTTEFCYLNLGCIYQNWVFIKSKSLSII